MVPSESTFETMSSTRFEAAMLRLANSPALYSRKKVAGKLRMRIMKADATGNDVFVRMRFTAISREAIMSCRAKRAQSMNAAVDHSTAKLPVLAT